MAKTQQEPEKILMADRTHDAASSIEKAEGYLPAINQVLNAWRQIGFSLDPTTVADMQRLIYQAEEVVTQQRKEQIPAALAGLNQDKALTLMDQPAGLPAFYEALAGLYKVQQYFAWGLYRYDAKKKEFVLCDKSCEAYIESHKTYATGRQIEALRLAEQIAEALNQLTAMDSELSPTNLFTTPGLWGDRHENAALCFDRYGSPKFKISNKAFCMRVQP